VRNIIFIAPPAAGKGTQAEILKNKYNIAHISTGDLLREEVKKGTELGEYLSEQMKSGKLIKNEIVTELLKNRLENDDTNNGYILDGYPRSIEQAESLEELLENLDKKIDYIFYLDIDEDIAMKRACGRLQCGSCGKIYNKFFVESSPKEEGICDTCHIELTHREDDNEESFKKRFQTFIESTKPLIDYYKKQKLLYTIDSSISKENTSEQISKVLSKQRWFNWLQLKPKRKLSY